jgi:hypothetical protein
MAWEFQEKDEEEEVHSAGSQRYLGDAFVTVRRLSP